MGLHLVQSQGALCIPYALQSLSALPFLAKFNFFSPSGLQGNLQAWLLLKKAVQTVPGKKFFSLMLKPSSLLTLTPRHFHTATLVVAAQVQAPHHTPSPLCFCYFTSPKAPIHPLACWHGLAFLPAFVLCLYTRGLVLQGCHQLPLPVPGRHGHVGSVLQSNIPPQLLAISVKKLLEGFLFNSPVITASVQGCLSRYTSRIMVSLA